MGVLVGGCPEGGPDLNDNNNSPPQRDSSVDAEVLLCGNNVCDEGDGEDCDNCPSDCLGVACSPVRHLTVQQYRDDHLGETGETVIDIRPYDDCVAGRIPGDNFCSILGDWWDGSQITDDGDFLDWAKVSVHNPMIFYGTAADADEVLAIGEAAWDQGYDNVFMIDGGIEAWRDEGWYQDISYDGLIALYHPPTEDVYLIDTMDATHFDHCHIQDATQLDTHDLYYGGQLVNGGQILLDMAPDLANDVLIFFCINDACVASEEASIAAEIIGYTHILHYKDGTEDWISSGGSMVYGPTGACYVPE